MLCNRHAAGGPQTKHRPLSRASFVIPTHEGTSATKALSRLDTRTHVGSLPP